MARFRASSFSVPGTCVQSVRALVPDPEALVALGLLVTAAAAHEIALPAGVELELDGEAIHVLRDELGGVHLAQAVHAI